VQVARPCRITRRLKAPRPAAGMSALSASSTLNRVFELGEPQPLETAEHVGVHRKAGQPEVDAAHHVARLASHSGQGDQIGQLGRDLAADRSTSADAIR